MESVVGPNRLALRSDSGGFQLDEYTPSFFRAALTNEPARVQRTWNG